MLGFDILAMILSMEQIKQKPWNWRYILEFINSSVYILFIEHSKLPRDGYNCLIPPTTWPHFLSIYLLNFEREMVIPSCICTNSTKNMLVKIVHPGGHVELHDRPVLAEEVMLRNPRCIVAYPHVFRQPWAIVAPDTMLLLGQKFYVVPINTIRKLQRRSITRSQSPINDVRASKTPNNDERGSDISSSCWYFINKNMKSPCPCLHRDDDERANTTGTNIDSKANTLDTSEETKSSSSIGCSETKDCARKRRKEMTTGSPNRFTSLDQWQPNLDSIVEEHQNK